MKKKSNFRLSGHYLPSSCADPARADTGGKHSLITWEKKSKNVVSMYLELQEKEAYVGSDQYIVDTAKSKLGMTYPDEIVFKEKMIYSILINTKKPWNIVPWLLLLCGVTLKRINEMKRWN